MAVSCRTHVKIGEIHFKIVGSQMGNQLIKFTDFHAKLKCWTIVIHPRHFFLLNFLTRCRIKATAATFLVYDATGTMMSYK